MSDDAIVRMANQIAIFYEPYSEEEGIEGVREHIQKFWEARMKTELFETHQSHPEKFKPIVCSAIELLKTPTS